MESEMVRSHSLFRPHSKRVKVPHRIEEKQQIRFLIFQLFLRDGNEIKWVEFHFIPRIVSRVSSRGSKEVSTMSQTELTFAKTLVCYQVREFREN